MKEKSYSLSFELSSRSGGTEAYSNEIKPEYSEGVYEIREKSFA